MKLSLIQLKTAAAPEQNIARILPLLKQAKAKGADMAVLPEMCACPYENAAFVRYAMELDAPFLQELGAAAKELGLYLVAGSVPEKCKNKIYNTSVVFDSKGHRTAFHRKMHLFDINIEGGQYFMESDTFTPGEWLTTFPTPWGRFGLMICYDIRFPELARLLVLEGADAVIVPAAFNMTTGPAHWELSFRARALDNQIFMAGCAPARDTNASYHSWGHSIVTDPWGTVLGQLEEKEDILTVELDFSKVEKVRRELPLLKHRRTDLYGIGSVMSGTDTNWR